MYTTRRFAVTALLALGAMVSASTSARAQATGGFGWFTCPLYRVVGVGDPDYGATGQYDFGGQFTGRGQDPSGYSIYYFEGTLILSCWDLTPGAVYSAGDKKTHARKDGSVDMIWRRVTFAYYVPWNAPSLQDGWWGFGPPSVYRLNADRTSTPVLE